MTATIHNINRAEVTLERAIMTAIKGLANFSPTRITGQPDAADAENLKFDLLTLCEIVDPLVKAVGEYADHHFGISKKDMKECFTDQLRGALEGNATFIMDREADGFRVQSRGSDNQRHDFIRSLTAAE